MASVRLIVSYPKSGMTWTRILLAALDRGDKIDINSISSSIPLSSRSWIDEQLMMESVGVPRERQRELQGLALRALKEDGTERTVFGNTHSAHPGAAEVENPFPPSAIARVLYVIRNPLSVAPSYAHHMGIPLDQAIERLADPDNGLRGGTDDLHHRSTLPVSLGSWSGHVRSWRESGLDVMTVRYEDLLDDGPHTLTSIARFLNLPDDPRGVENALHHHRFDRLKQQEVSEGFRGSQAPGRRFFRTGSATAWRTELSARQVARIVEAHREEMTRYGYLP